MAGYSGTPLVRKLGLKATACAYFVNIPPHYFDLLSPIPDGVVIVDRPIQRLDFVHMFMITQKEFRSIFPKVMKQLRKDGMIWVSWPKKSSKVATDLDENSIREYGLNSGMVDVKVCAVDQTWSALKFVYRLENR